MNGAATSAGPAFGWELNGAERSPRPTLAFGVPGLCALFVNIWLGKWKARPEIRSTGRSKRLGDKPLHLKALRLSNPLFVINNKLMLTDNGPINRVSPFDESQPRPYCAYYRCPGHFGLGPEHTWAAR